MIWLLDRHTKNNTSIRRRAARPGDDYIVRPPGARPRDDVLRGLAPEVALGPDRVERRVRSKDHSRMLRQRMVRGNRLLRHDIDAGAVETTRLQRSDQIVDVDDAAARRVDEVAARAH